MKISLPAPGCSAALHLCPAPLLGRRLRPWTAPGPRSAQRCARTSPASAHHPLPARCPAAHGCSRRGHLHWRNEKNTLCAPPNLDALMTRSEQARRYLWPFVLAACWVDFSVTRAQTNSEQGCSMRAATRLALKVSRPDSRRTHKAVRHGSTAKLSTDAGCTDTHIQIAMPPAVWLIDI